MSIGLGLAESAINAIAGFGQAAQQQKYQKELMELQNQYQIEFWNMNNAYNAPKAQRQRLEDAGLNPDLFYGGSGNVTPAQMPTAASGQAPRVDFGRFNLLQAYQMSLNADMAKAQIDKVNADASLVKAQEEQVREDTVLKRSQIGQVEADTKLKGSQWLLNIISSNYQDQYLHLRNQKVGYDVGIAYQNWRLAAFNADHASARFRMEQLRVDNETKDIQIRLEQLGLNRQKLFSDVKKINAEVDRIISDNLRIRQLTLNLTQEEKNLILQKIKNKALNKYFYDKGRIPSSGGLAAWLWNTAGNIDTDLGF